MTSWIIIGVSVVLAVVAVYQEVVRSNRARLGLRIIAVLVAIAALACLILPVSYKSGVQSNSGGVILLTPGFQKDSLKSGNQIVYTMDSAIAKAYPHARLVSNPAEIFAGSATRLSVHVYGYGLNDKDLKQLAGSQVVFHPSTVPDGITAVNWTKTIHTGELFEVQGSVKNSGKPFRLLLKGLNTVLDSARISTGSSVSFSIGSLPKQAGKVTYDLIGIRDKDTLFNEQLSMIAESAKPVKVLMLSAAPDFENKFLRLWLGNNNYAVASRAIITKGKIGQDYFNMERVDLSRITPELLSKFDIVEADLSAIKTLPAAESAALQGEVNNKGIGLIIRADTIDSQSNTWVQNSFKVTRSAKQPPAELIIQGKKTAKLSLDPQYINPQNNVQPVVTDVKGNLIAAATLSGAGKLIISMINNSYSWDLAGNRNDYAAYWTALINKAVRKTPAANNWSVVTPFPEPGEPVTLIYHGADLTGPARINQSVVAPVQDAGIPFERRFTYWPQQPGWQQAVATDGAPYWWFVWPKNSFTALQATETARKTTEYAQKSTKYASFSGAKLQKVDVEISKFYFYILLLVAATFLWAESKYLTQIN